ncbi:hypothetical protein [Okeania sp. SIO3I5]|uniref:hypothetical protein n=1 Tax=Okeania sp. SIO3I5 TaxID=2607805 RepID=UPI0025F587E2|nr:hypothetical protein [Okeania sp. SIO3I5]
MASFFSAALEMFDQNALFLNYKQLPEAIWSSIPDFFQISLSENEKEQMRELMQYYSKGKERKKLFTNYSAVKKQEATELVKLMVDKWLGELYKRLELVRHSQLTHN